MPRYRKPRANLYTALLLIALLALSLCILCLYHEMGAYNFDDRAAPRVSLRVDRPASAWPASPDCAAAAARFA